MQAPHWYVYEGITLISSDVLLYTEGKKFKEAFVAKFGYLPAISAYYVYDGTNLITKAIRQAGLDREAIKDYLTSNMFPGCATGSIIFDDQGNRKDPIRFTRIQNGSPVLLE